MKKMVSLCVTGLFLASATLCCAQAPPAAAPAAPAAPAAAPAAPAKPLPPANKPGMVPAAWSTATVGTDVKEVSSSTLKGKAYGIIFVNSACADCRTELSEMHDYKFKSEFNFFVAAVDLKMDRAIEVYKGEMSLPFTIIDDSKRQVGRVFGLTFSPASVIVGADGKVEYAVAGYTDETRKSTLEAFKKYLQ